MSITEKHLVLVSIEEGTRAVSTRILGAYAESLGIRTTLLMIVRPLATFDHPVVFKDSEVRQIMSFLDREGVTHLGFYLMTAGFKPYRLLVGALRERGYKRVIMAGGVHATLCPDESLVDGADYAVTGPGELPLKMLLEGSSPSAIPGLVWRDENGKKRVNPETPPQRVDLDLLPFPIFRSGRDRVLVKGKLRKFTWSLHKKYAEWHGRYYDLITSRGCAYKCAYCCNAVHRGPVRRSGVDRVIKELKNLKAVAPMIRGINIQDDNFFSGPKEWIEEFCRRMKEEVGFPFIVRMIPKFVTPERVALLKAGGLEYVTMGLEGSGRMNKGVFNRPEDSESFVKAATTILQSGLLLSIDLIVDNPFERESDLQEIAATLNRLPRGNWWIVHLSLTPFPNTPLHERCRREGMLDRFSTDAYDAMLMPSRKGGYRTPRFWFLLITVVLPRINPQLGARLIRVGPAEPWAAKVVDSLAVWIIRTKKVTTWLRDNTPIIYGAIFRLLKLFSRRPIPSGMRVFD